MKIERRKEKLLMSVRIGVKGLALTSMLLLSFFGISILGIGMPVAAVEYPPLPVLLVTNPEPGLYDIEIMGEQGGDLNPYWDVQGFDLYLHYNIEALEPIDVQMDPDNVWGGTFYHGIWPFADEINYDEGYVRAGFVGIAIGPHGDHTPPSGKIRVLHVEFHVIDPDLPTGIGLMNPEPRPEIPPWGPEYFRTTLIGFPHSEREEAPWFNVLWTVPIPHLTSPPIARISASPMTPNPSQIVAFDGSASYHPGIITSYAWDFESDGVTDAYGVTATHAYSLKGFHLATLTVTDMQGSTDSATVLISVKSLQRGWAEHPVYRVSKDEDSFNTLFVRILNEGPASANVKAVFVTYDKRTGMQIGETLETLPDFVPPESFFDVQMNFNPEDFEWEPGTTSDYEVRANLYYFNDAWILAGTDKILFKVVP